MTFETLLAKLNFDENIETAIRQKITANSREIEVISFTAYQENKDGFLLCNHSSITRLVVVTYLLPQKYEEYKKLNLSDKIIIDTFQDVSLRARCYFQKYHKVGISKEDVIWFRHLMNVKMFKIGSLQFQPFEMVYLDEETLGEPYMTFLPSIKQALPSGTPVINCHLQQGADLSPKQIDESLHQASQLFQTMMPNIQPKAFLCYSWLLYEPMRQYLKEDSKILSFSSRFQIIGSCSDTEQAFENLFVDQSKLMTSLQKAVHQHPEYFGYACGVIWL